MQGSIQYAKTVQVLIILCLLVLNLADALSREEIAELCMKLPSGNLTVGVVLQGTAASTLAEWGPTFHGYLGFQLSKHGCGANIVVLDSGDLNEALAQKRVHFVMLDPISFHEQSVKHGLRVFLGLRRPLGNHEATDQTGGVIARAAGKHTAVFTLSDLRTIPGKLTLCAASRTSFTGWYIQFAEMLSEGFNVTAQFDVRFVGDHENQILQLVAGHCDLAFAKSGSIERLVAKKHLNVSDVFVIGDRMTSVGFPLHISTPLFPNWPLSTLAHTPRALEQLTAVPLLTMDQNSTEAIAGGHAGFTFPYEYDSVQDVLLAVNHYGDGRCRVGQLRQSDFPRQCQACAAGTFNADGTSGCQPCPVGFVNNGTGNLKCDFCPEGTTTSTPGSITGACIRLLAPLQHGASVWDEPGTWINVGVGATALVCLLALTVYAKRRSGSILAALDILGRGILPSVVSFCMELSDLASDVACALTVLGATSLNGFPPALRVVYFACVSAHAFPSIMTLVNKGRNLRLKALHIDRIAPGAPSVQPNIASDGEEELSGMWGTKTGTSMTLTVDTGLSDTIAGTIEGKVGLVQHPLSHQSSLVKLVREEHRQLLRQQAVAQLKDTAMPPFIIGMFLEDFLVGLLNTVALVNGIGYADFRAHALFPLLAVATASSLVNLGFKVGLVGRWLSIDLVHARESAQRVTLLCAVLPELNSRGARKHSSFIGLTRQFTDSLRKSASNSLSRFASFGRSLTAGGLVASAPVVSSTSNPNALWAPLPECAAQGTPSGAEATIQDVR